MAWWGNATGRVQAWKCLRELQLARAGAGAVPLGSSLGQLWLRCVMGGRWQGPFPPTATHAKRTPAPQLIDARARHESCSQASCRDVAKTCHEILLRPSFKSAIVASALPVTKHEA